MVAACPRVPRVNARMGRQASLQGMMTGAQLLPFMVLLFILPFPGTVVVRLICLGAGCLVVGMSWRQLAPPPLPCRWAIALWGGVAIVSLGFAVDPAYSRGEIRNEVGYALMAFVAFFAWTRDERRLRLACLAVLAGFAVISVSALLGGDLRRGQWPPDAYYGGVGGVSNYLVTVGPVLALATVLLGRQHPRKWAGLVGVPFLAVSLLSAQRALWPAVGLQAALVCVWLWHVRAVAVGPVCLVVMGVILLAVIGGGVYVSERYRTGGDPDSPFVMRKDVRPRVWERVGEEILAHPLTGAGFGRDVMSKAYPGLLPAESKELPHSHNLVLNYGMSAGVPGMVAVLALFGSLGWRLWQLALRGEPLARLAGLAGAAMVAGVLARNMTNDFFVRDGAMVFWALLGSLFGYALRRGAASGEDRVGLRHAWSIEGAGR